MARLSLAAIEDLSRTALRRAGAAAHQADPVARAIRRAEADDLSAVGLGYLPVCLAHLRGGKIAGDAVPARREGHRLTAIRIDAASGFAHPSFDIGVEPLAAAARGHGIAALSIVRSYSIGVLGHPVEDIADRGLIALAFTNSPPNMAPWGGRKKLFGTNPLAFAVPRADAPPLVVDQATTAVTKVRLAAAATSGAAIPPDWAFDVDGKPTTDPKAALAGSMAPSGAAKGANLALLVEVLAAALTGANLSADIAPYAVGEGVPPGTGQFFIAIDPTAFADGFAERIGRLAGAIIEDAPARLPGARRLAARAHAVRAGVEVDDALLARIAA